MIVIVHSLYFLIKYYLKFIKKKRCLQEFREFKSICQAIRKEAQQATIDVEENLTFDPPVYKQRYAAAQEVLLDTRWKDSIKKIVDFGCAEFGLFTFIKRLFRIEEILEVDISETLLKENLFRLNPLTMDYLNRRTEPLVIHVLTGSISNPDRRLIGTDVVVAIEIIEHLYPDTLDALPYNIFGFIKPKLAIFTTPNADFNVLFRDFKGLRHADHKFEWTRRQFESWATNIVTRFPNYSVTFRGIGEGPAGYKYLGCCSQMAVFEKNIPGEEIETDMHVEGTFNVADSTCTCNSCVQKSSFGVCTYLSCTSGTYESLDVPIPLFCNYYGSYIRTASNYYKVIKTIEYPYEPDYRTAEQKILDEMKYRICLMGGINGRFYNEDLNRCEIPVVNLIYNQLTHFTTVHEASEILAKADYKIEECMICGELETCVIYEPVMESDSTSSISPSSTPSRCQDRENSGWTTISTEDEASDWDDGTQIKDKPWSEGIQPSQSSYDWLQSQEKEHVDAAQDINAIIDNIISKFQESSVSESSQNFSKPRMINLHNTKKHDKYNKSNTNITTASTASYMEDCERYSNLGSISEPNNVLNDSGYCRSNTNLTNSTPSCPDILDSDDQYISSASSEERINSDNTAIVTKEKKLLHDERITPKLNTNTKDCKTEKRKEASLPKHSQAYEIRNLLNGVSGSTDKSSMLTKLQEQAKGNAESTKPNTSPHTTAKHNATKMFHLKDTIRESIPGTSNSTRTSNSKRKKKSKRPENDDDDDTSGHTLKSDEDEKKIEPENKVNVPEIVEVAPVPDPIVENGDLANNNRDVEGNNYPDAQQNGILIQEIDNENVVLENVLANGEDHRNEDIENRNEYAEEEEAKEDDAGGPSVNSSDASEFEIEFASREALFDPNSQVDLLEEYNVPSTAPVLQNVEVSSPNAILLGVNGVNIESDDPEVGPILPVSADPFPNWLLHLLGTDIIEDGENHDEPHFYCQGDGIGVHPSFIDEDFEDDHSSSGSDSTTSSGSTNDDAEAEPTVSEIEVISLPDDNNTNETTSEQPITSITNGAETTQNLENQTLLETNAGSSSGAESADEYFDSVSESACANSNRSGKNRVENKN